MTATQARTTKTVEEAHRVGYYENGKLKWTPTMADLEGDQKIKQIIETQGHDVALQILEAQEESDAMTLAQGFELDMKIRSIEATDGTIAEYEKEAARTWMPRLGYLPLDTITRQHVIDFVVWYKDQPTERSKRTRAKAEKNGEPLPPIQKVKAKTVRNAHTLLSSVLQSAVEKRPHRKERRLPHPCPETTPSKKWTSSHPKNGTSSTPPCATTTSPSSSFCWSPDYAWAKPAQPASEISTPKLSPLVWSKHGRKAADVKSSAHTNHNDLDASS